MQDPQVIALAIEASRANPDSPPHVDAFLPINATYIPCLRSPGSSTLHREIGQPIDVDDKVGLSVTLDPSSSWYAPLYTDRATIACWTNTTISLLRSADRGISVRTELATSAEFAAYSTNAVSKHSTEWDHILGLLVNYLPYQKVEGGVFDALNVTISGRGLSHYPDGSDLVVTIGGLAAEVHRGGYDKVDVSVPAGLAWVQVQSQLRERA